MGVKTEERKKEILRVISNKKKLTVEELFVISLSYYQE